MDTLILGKITRSCTYKRMFGHQKLCKIDSNIDNEISYKYFIAKHLSSRPNRSQLVDIFSKGAFNSYFQKSAFSRNLQLLLGLYYEFVTNIILLN